MSRTAYAHSLTWKRCQPPVDDGVVEQLEQALGVTFPHDFRELMKRCHGGSPVEREHFDFYYVGGQHEAGSCLGALLTLYPEDSNGILKTIETLSYDDQLPEKVIPFAEDGGGDMMCLDYRDDPEHPTVVYWSHEEPKETSISPLADSFTKFLDSLQPPIDVDALLSKQ
jgi:cell wall assembly regulator SMI1